MVSAISVNDTLYINTVTNFSIYVNESVTFDSINLTDTGRIEISGLNTTATVGNFYNINDTYNSTIDFFGLTNALIFWQNGTIINQQFTGNINLSMPTLTNITIMNNYVIDDGDTPSSGDPVNSGGGPGDTKINNTLLGPLAIQVENLDNSFIFMSNTTVLTFVDGSLNITLSPDEFFYIVDYEQLLAFNENQGTTAHDLSGNSNDGTLTGPTWATDGILITLTALTDYTINPTTGLFTIVNNDFSWSELIVSYTYGVTANDQRALINNLTGGVAVFFTFSNVWFTLLAIVLLIIIVMSVITFVGKNNKSNVSS